MARLLADLMRAAVELGLARLRLGSSDLSPLIEREAAPQVLDPRQLRRVERIAYTIPRVAVRLPWRADCLVQALAAEHWLLRFGIGSRLHLGVANEKIEPFEAHAWLTVGECVVTGGPVADYASFNRPVPLEAGKS